jgi:mRNA interferase MazF
MYTPGQVIVVPFPGAVTTKRRPVVVLSTATYHTHRPDLVLGLLTTDVAAAVAPTDYVLQDWAAGGLHQATAFRSFLSTIPASDVVRVIGQLSDRDWQEVKQRLRLALDVS